MMQIAVSILFQRTVRKSYHCSINENESSLLCYNKLYSVQLASLWFTHIRATGPTDIGKFCNSPALLQSHTSQKNRVSNE